MLCNDISFIQDRALRISLENTIYIVNNTDAWNSIKIYNNREFNSDLLFHLYKIDVVMQKLKKNHALSDYSIRRNFEILNYISKHGIANFEKNYTIKITKCC